MSTPTLDNPGPDEQPDPGRLRRELEERLNDPQAKADLRRIGPEHRRPGSALPPYLRGNPPSSPLAIPAARRRYLAERRQKPLTHEFARRNAWKFTDAAFALSGLKTGRRGPGGEALSNDGPHMELRRPLYFIAGRRPVAMVVFPYATPEQARAFAAFHGLVAHTMPPDGWYMPQAGALGPGAPIAVALTRPDVANVQWPLDPSGTYDWSEDSPECSAEEDADTGSSAADKSE